MRNCFVTGWRNERIYKLLVKFLTWGSSISDERLDFLSSVAGDLWFTLDAKHRKVSLSNLFLVKDRLERAYGSPLGSRDLYAISRQNFRHITRVFLEIPRFRSITAENVQRFVRCTGAKEIKKASSEGKGVILLTGHFGNWELTAHVAPFFLGTPINIIARPLDFPPLERLVTEIRCGTGNRVFARRSSARKVLKSLKNNEIIGILQDQRSSKHEGIVAPFMGRPALTHKGMAILATRTGAAVIPVFSHREKSGRYHIEIHPRVYLFNTGDVKKDILLNTMLFNRILENQVVKYPEQWFWVHRRWLLKRKKKKRLFARKRRK